MGINANDHLEQTFVHYGPKRYFTGWLALLMKRCYLPSDGILFSEVIMVLSMERVDVSLKMM